MKNFKEQLLEWQLKEKKQPDYTITIREPKDSRRAFDILKKNKIKFRDESSTLFVFKKEDQWDAAMDLLDDISVEFDMDG